MYVFITWPLAKHFILPRIVITDKTATRESRPILDDYYIWQY